MTTKATWRQVLALMLLSLCLIHYWSVLRLLSSILCNSFICEYFRLFFHPVPPRLPPGPSSVLLPGGGRTCFPGGLGSGSGWAQSHVVRCGTGLVRFGLGGVAQGPVCHPAAGLEGRASKVRTEAACGDLSCLLKGVMMRLNHKMFQTSACRDVSVVVWPHRRAGFTAVMLHLNTLVHPSESRLSLY